MKKIFRTLLFVACAMISVSVNAQEEEQAAGKPNVFIDYFYRPAGVSVSWAENLRGSIIEGISATGRVELIDAASREALKLEEDRRNSENVVSGGDMERLKVMTTEGANYLITGTITSMATEKKKLDSGSIYYGATCAYTLKVINPANGKLISTKTFKHGDGITNMANGDTQDEAIAKVCRQAIKAVSELVEEAFKVQGVILEISEVKKDEAKEVYISIGSDHGVGEDAMFSACIERTVAGRKSTKEIGELKVKNVEGGDLTLCEVKKGGKEIKSAIDGGQTIVVKSKKKKESLFGGLKKAVDSI